MPDQNVEARTRADLANWIAELPESKVQVVECIGDARMYRLYTQNNCYQIETNHPDPDAGIKLDISVCSNTPRPGETFLRGRSFVAGYLTPTKWWEFLVSFVAYELRDIGSELRYLPLKDEQ